MAKISLKQLRLRKGADQRALMKNKDGTPIHYDQQDQHPVFEETVHHTDYHDWHLHMIKHGAYSWKEHDGGSIVHAHDKNGKHIGTWEGHPRSPTGMGWLHDDRPIFMKRQAESVELGEHYVTYHSRRSGGTLKFDSKPEAMKKIRQLKKQGVKRVSYRASDPWNGGYEEGRSRKPTPSGGLGAERQVEAVESLDQLYPIFEEAGLFENLSADRREEARAKAAHYTNLATTAARAHLPGAVHTHARKAQRYLKVAVKESHKVKVGDRVKIRKPYLPLYGGYGNGKTGRTNVANVTRASHKYVSTDNLGDLPVHHVEIVEALEVTPAQMKEWRRKNATPGQPEGGVSKPEESVAQQTADDNRRLHGVSEASIYANKHLAHLLNQRRIAKGLKPLSRIQKNHLKFKRLETISVPVDKLIPANRPDLKEANGTIDPKHAYGAKEHLQLNKMASNLVNSKKQKTATDLDKTLNAVTKLQVEDYKVGDKVRVAKGAKNAAGGWTPFAGYVAKVHKVEGDNVHVHTSWNHAHSVLPANHPEHHWYIINKHNIKLVKEDTLIEAGSSKASMKRKYLGKTKGRTQVGSKAHPIDVKPKITFKDPGAVGRAGTMKMPQPTAMKGI